MAKVLIVQWIIRNCDNETFIGMRWENRAKGIFWLYWKHQSSRSCRENSAEAASLYEYYRAWARHKNRIDGKKKPRDLKAAFRNALEKKQELERLNHLETKERIYWRIKNFPNDQNETYAPSRPSLKLQKPKGRRGRKTSNNLIQNDSEFPINFGASTSTASEDGTFGRKKSRSIPTKGTRKVSCKAKKSLAAEEQVVSSSYDPSMNGFSVEQEEEKNQPPLPPFQFIRRNEHDTGSWENSVENTDSTFSPQPPQFSETPYGKSKVEDVWTPQMLTQFTPPRLSSDLMEVSSTEFMDLLVPNQRINYSFQPTPPQETSDILFDNITDADLMTLGKIIDGGEHSILKYSFPFQPEEVTPSPSHLSNVHTQQVPATSLHCCPSDFVSMTKISNVQNNNCVLNLATATVNAFCFDQRQGSYDQVVPPYCEAFQTSPHPVDISDTFVNDCLLYSPPSMDNCKITEEICHQQADTECHSTELFRYSNQTSQDDSGISDMEDFLDCANKLLDDIEFQYDTQRHQTC